MSHQAARHHSAPGNKNCRAYICIVRACAPDRKKKTTTAPMNSEWPEWSRAVWLLVPLGALYCIAESWFPFVVIFAAASVPAVLCVAVLVVLAAASALEMALKTTCAWYRSYAHHQRLQEQQLARLGWTPSVASVSLNKWWKCRSSLILYSPRGEEMHCCPDIEQRASNELALTEAEGGGRPRLQRYIMHMATICYGKGKTRIAQIFSTCVDFTAGGRVSTLNWMRDCSKDDRELRDLVGGGRHWPMLPAASDDAEAVERWRERYRKCDRKSPHVKFWDVREYDTGHRFVRHAKLSVGATYHTGDQNVRLV
jgi:hypothetical protein